jgi:signal transduction histidine kinase
MVPATIGLVYTIASWDVPSPAQGFGPRGFEFIFALAFAVAGLILAMKRPSNPIGWLFLVASVGAGLQQLSDGFATWAVVEQGSFSVPARLAAVGEDWTWIVSFSCLSVVLSIFPDGQPISRRWGRWIVGCFVVALIGAVAIAMSDRSLTFPQVENPLGVRGMLAVGGVAAVGFLLLLVIGFGSVLIRFRGTSGDAHEQMKWLAFSSGIVIAAFVLYLPMNLAVGGNPSSPIANVVEILVVLGVATIPVSIAIGVLRYRLYDIDIVIKKTVVFTILVALLLTIGAVAGVLVGLGVVPSLSDHTMLLLVFGIACGALSFPLYRAATRLADRVVYRGRATSYEVLTEFSRRMAVAYGTEDVLPRLAAVLGTGTGATRAVVWLELGSDDRVGAVWPADATEPSRPPADAVEVLHVGERLGALSVEMPPNDPMSPEKAKIVRDLADHAGPVLRNVRLIEELRDSRRRLVAAQDEERRRIERDIHDGAQQQLVALAVQQRLAAALVGKDDDRVRAILQDLQAATNEALEDLRDLARGIYPPLLADRGLGAALEAQARKAAVPTTVDADGIERYPQEVESAVYFCCLEAMNNLAKYADASRATLELASSNGFLVFSVADDGRGFDVATAERGTGLQSMADRLDAIGGSLLIESDPGRGTTVRGTVPAETSS